MNKDEILKEIRMMQSRGKKLFVSSSFQTHSIPLLHILSQAPEKIPVVFLNTGFHFPETLKFRDRVSELLGLNLVDVHSSVPKLYQCDKNGNLLYHSNPDECCWHNKVTPMIPVLESYDIWINGVRGNQSTVRKSFETFQPTEYRAVRFHPILDWTSKMIFDYRMQYNLPEHPLEKKGIFSVGCEPCTAGSEGRLGRWAGLEKTECGLHTQL